MLTGLPEDIIIGCLQRCTRKIIPDSFEDSATFYTNVGKNQVFIGIEDKDVTSKPFIAVIRSKALDQRPHSQTWIIIPKTN